MKRVANDMCSNLGGYKVVKRNVGLCSKLQGFKHSGCLYSLVMILGKGTSFWNCEGKNCEVS